MRYTPIPTSRIFTLAATRTRAMHIAHSRYPGSATITVVNTVVNTGFFDLLGIHWARFDCVIACPDDPGLSQKIAALQLIGMPPNQPVQLVERSL